MSCWCRRCNDGEKEELCKQKNKEKNKQSVWREGTAKRHNGVMEIYEELEQGHRPEEGVVRLVFKQMGAIVWAPPTAHAAAATGLGPATPENALRPWSCRFTCLAVTGWAEPPRLL